jgi:hypothetical protein
MEAFALPSRRISRGKKRQVLQNGPVFKHEQAHRLPGDAKPFLPRPALGNSASHYRHPIAPPRRRQCFNLQSGKSIARVSKFGIPNAEHSFVPTIFRLKFSH